MSVFSVCYDKFCIGRYTLESDEEGNILPFDGLGAFEMYLLSMWNDGMVVTMKGYDEEMEENRFILLLPDGSEQLMSYSPETGFSVKHLRQPKEGRFAYLLEFLKGFEYQGYRGYEEYDEEENRIIGWITIGDQSFTYGGHCLREVKEDFIRVVGRIPERKE